MEHWKIYNQLLIRLRWRAVSSSATMLSPSSSTTSCGYNIDLDPAGNVTRLTSPNWPSPYDDNLNCEWVIRQAFLLVNILVFWLVNVPGLLTQAGLNWRYCLSTWSPATMGVPMTNWLSMTVSILWSQYPIMSSFPRNVWIHELEQDWWLLQKNTDLHSSLYWTIHEDCLQDRQLQVLEHSD